jgi:hypothetical protein
MADNDGLLFSEGCDQRHHVADRIEDAVGIDIGGRAGAAKTPHIRCYDMEVRRHNRGDLMPPGIGQFGPAMAKQHERTRALFKQEDIDAVGGNGAGGC